MTHARALKVGDTIGIAAPASPFDKKKFMKGVHALEKLGFKTFYRDDIFDQNRYLAGTDARRAEEFTWLFTNKKIDAIMFARGGYGSQRIIPLLDVALLNNTPKPVIGFSDITALLNFLNQNSDVPAFYGPAVTQLGRQKSGVTGEMFVKALTTAGPLGEMPVGDAKTINPGEASGRVVGGCMTLINSSMGTPYEVDTTDSILLIEDVGEKIYVLDRMLTQLKNSGKLAKAKGIIFGSLIPPEEEPYDVESMIRDVMSGFDKPVIMNYPAGHIDEFVTLPLGAEANLVAPVESSPTFNYTSGLLS